MKNVVLFIWMLVPVLMPINALAEDPPEQSMEELSKLMGELQYAVIAPDNLGPDLTIMLQANFVIKNPFGSL